MVWNLLGDIADLIAAVTVIGSLIYMASQVKHARQTFISGSQQQVSLGLANMMADVWRDKDVCALWVKGMTDQESLSEAEHDRFGMLLFSYFHHFSNILELAEVEACFLEGNQAMIDRTLRVPSVQGWWSRQSHTFSKAGALHRYVNQRIPQLNAAQTAPGS